MRSKDVVTVRNRYDREEGLVGPNIHSERVADMFGVKGTMYYCHPEAVSSGALTRGMIDAEITRLREEEEAAAAAEKAAAEAAGKAEEAKVKGNGRKKAAAAANDDDAPEEPGQQGVAVKAAKPTRRTRGSAIS